MQDAALVREKKKSLLQRIWDARTAYLFILPAYIPFLIFVVYPLVDGLRLSFYEAGINKAKWKFVGFQNFIRLFTTDNDG